MKRRHTYKAAERFIMSREFFGMKLGLKNITEFLASMGRPQDEYKTVHLSGTNGKGSTAAMLAAVLQRNGYRTGLFTSPHLVDFTERILVDSQPIPRRAVISFIDRYRPVLVKKNSRSLSWSRPWRWTISRAAA
jgi:dihydrofolate synthase/folylpolyglutamate synthase